MAQNAEHHAAQIQSHCSPSTTAYPTTAAAQVCLVQSARYPFPSSLQYPLVQPSNGAHYHPVSHRKIFHDIFILIY